MNKDFMMFCHQCQETARNQGCKMKQGVCGKKADVSNLQDLLIWVLKGISVWGVEGSKLDIYEEKTGYFIAKSLFMTITNADFAKSNFIRYIKKGIEIRDNLKQKVKLEYEKQNNTQINISEPECAVWKPENDDDILNKADSGDVSWLAIEDEDIRSLKATVRYGLKGISAYLEHAYQIKKEGREIFEFLMKALAELADENKTQEELIDLVMKTGEMGVKTMKFLDEANAEYGEQEISEVNLGVGNNPGILISGHDFVDLEELLEQTKGQGVDVYTHSEMLPAHYRPFFKKYDHLIGNYGGSWYLQENEIDSFNGPVLFTSNCLVPPKLNYKDRIFTTGAVDFEGLTYIPDRKEGEHKDFSALIKMAKKCDPPEELETGKIVGGFGHGQVMKLADKIIEAVKSGYIKKFVVMAGCDGRHKERKYFTEIAENLPETAVILTAGCAKYRYFKLDLGDIGGIPRVLDAGQCNDSYSLAVIAMRLQEAFELDDINDLPLAFDIAWYEQKAVLVFLALLSLGFKNIRLGPTLPGFLSKNITDFLVEKFGVQGIDTVEKDVKTIMSSQ